MANEHPKFEDDPNDHPSSLSHMFLSLALLAQRDSAAHISSANVLNKYAACGWAVVQMELDGGMTPWCGVGGIMSVSSEVQRAIKRAEF